jgi:HEAT repeat protein
LEQRYALPSSRPETRSEIIRALGALGTHEGIRALSRIFARERREELRLEIIGAIADMDDDKVLEPKLSFFATALSPKLSRLIREVAISSLSEMEDSRVIPLLRNLRFDGDSEIQTLVAETLRDLEQ